MTVLNPARPIPPYPLGRLVDEALAALARTPLRTRITAALAAADTDAAADAGS